MNAQQTVPAFVLKWVALVFLGLCLPMVSSAKGNLQTRVEVLEQQMAAVIDANVALQEANAALQAKLACVSDDSNMDSFIFRGCNVHVRNGEGSTDTINGFGNLIVGYDEPAVRGPDTWVICSNGTYEHLDLCALYTGEDEWDYFQKTGSHNLVLGDGNIWTQYGGFVAGSGNVINREYAVVSGGRNNLASGVGSSVSGGYGNHASGNSSSVSGGLNNIASGGGSSILGGERNIASGGYSSVSGGYGNTADGDWSST